MIRILNPINPCKACYYNYLNPHTCVDKEYDYTCDGCTSYYCCQNASETEMTCPYYKEIRNDDKK
jgi:hypothetical protein